MSAHEVSVTDPAAAPILFVCGLHRSGTTALARALGSSPGVRSMSHTGVFADEGQHLQRVIAPASRFGGPGAFALDPRSWLTERSGLVTSSNARTVLADWSPFWRLLGEEDIGWGSTPGQVVLLEKSPPNLVRTRFLQALFPNARFVTVYRHPGVVAMSTRRMRPARRVEDVVNHWLVAHERYELDAPLLHTVHEVRYEDLVAEPATVLRDLAVTVGIDARFDLTLLERGRSDAHERAWEAVVPTLPPAFVQRLEGRIGRYGYSMRPPYVVPLGERTTAPQRTLRRG